VSAVGPPLVVGHLTGAVDTDDTTPFLLINEEQHPAAIGDAKHHQVVPVPTRGVWVRETLLCLERGHIVAQQQLLLVVFIPFKLGQV